VTRVSVTTHLWTTPKPDAESGKENEDRFWLSGCRPDDSFENCFRAAVADGASGSLFSREWARELTRVYCQSSHSLPDDVLWQRAAADWEHCIAGKDLPWYLAAKRAEGAQAAFIGVSCCKNGTWEAVAAGDCCLFQRRGTALAALFPLTRVDDFSFSPALWATHALPPQNAAATRREAGRWEIGDCLYLMTDALALWCLREIEAKRDPWVWLDGIVSDKDFRQRIDILRENGRLRGDDTTVLHLRFDDSGKESCGK
jgi:hypothetical protein